MFRAATQVQKRTAEGMKPETHEQEHLVGVISDTHGLLRPQAVEALQGVGLIIHAGDIGTFGVLESLRSIAPLIAVRGNMDTDGWAYALAKTEAVRVGRALLYVLHDLSRLDFDPVVAGVSAVISGHSHRPSCKTRDGVLYLNPGSAGHRRFDLPVTLAVIRIRDKSLAPEIIHLAV
jgi:hypothetical protein